MKDITEIDQNLSLNSSLTQEGLKFYDCRKSPFEIYGLYQPQNRPFRRLPHDVAQATSAGVLSLSIHTAGGRVRFRTDSPYVAINAKMYGIGIMGHFALCGSAGFDLYVDNRFTKAFIPPTDIQDGYESIIYLDGAKMREITINFPLYSGVQDLHIGLCANSQVLPTKGYIDFAPILFYGSSITQGACASRPGSSYTNIISTNYNVDYINLGFSGSARGEDAIAEYLSGINAGIFVYDYDHNAPTVEHLAATHQKLFNTYRKKNPDVPVIFVTRPDFDSNPADSHMRRAVVMNTYLNAFNSGDKNVYFVDGEGFYGSYRRDMFSVDGCHPNDNGMFKMAERISLVVEKILRAKNAI